MSAAVATRGDLAQRARQAPVARFMLVGAIAAIVGGIIVAMGIMSDAPERTWWAYHVNFMFWVGLAQALIIVAASQKLAKGHWSGTIIRFAEAAVPFTTVAVVLYVGLIVGRRYIFPWIHETRPDLGWWLEGKWFFLRNGVILVLLSWLSWRFVRRDTAPDVQEIATGQPVDRRSDGWAISRDAALVVLAFCFGHSLLAFDMIMSLAHKWVSNLFGIFYFMGSFLGALMFLAVVAIVLRRAMGLQGIYTQRQQHDLGKLCFGFTVFWAYLMWSQFLVIWYGNLPEETYFIFYRLSGAWKPIGVAVFFGVFLIPFIGLLGVKPKIYSPTMVLFAAISLTGLWLERYLEIVPSVNAGHGPAMGLPEVGTTLLYLGLFLVSWAWFASRYPIISPRLAQDALDREHP